jgi:hypothetical protein
MHAHHRIFAALLGVLLVLPGCASGSAGKGAHPSSPFAGNDPRLFEDGVDLVGDPDGLSGQWADDWSNEMRDRVSRSDLVALVTVNTLRTDINPEQHTTHWLVVGVDDVLKGGAGSKELSLASSQDELGFDSVDRERSTILRRPLLLLAKWVKQPNGEVRPAWHLASASQQVVAVVRSHLGGDIGAPKTIIETHEFQSDKR